MVGSHLLVYDVRGIVTADLIKRHDQEPCHTLLNVLLTNASSDADEG